MEPLLQIERLRNAGVVRVDVLHQSFAHPEEAALAFGLNAEPGIYTEVSAQEALRVLACVIHRDMAYGCELMPEQQAHQLASQFVQSFASVEPRYYTNGTFGQPRSSPTAGPTWSPATAATFDTGILVLTPGQAVCLWFEDED